MDIYIKNKVSIGLFLCLLCLMIVTLGSCKPSQELGVLSFETVTDSSELATSTELKFKITLDNPNNYTVNACEITKNETDSNSYPVEMALGRTDICYVTIPSFIYNKSDKYSLTNLSYTVGEETRSLAFSTKSYVKSLYASTVAEETIQVSNLTVEKTNVITDADPTDMQFGEEVQINVLIENSTDKTPHYVDITFVGTIIEIEQTRTIEIVRERNYLKPSSNGYYTFTTTVPTESEFDAKYQGDSSSVSWKVYASKIIYGSTNETKLLTANQVAPIKLSKTLFDIIEGSTQFNFNTASNFDINGYLYLGVGSRIPYLTLQVKNTNEYDINAVIVNNYSYALGSGLSLNKVTTGGGKSTILLSADVKLMNSNPEGIVVQGVTYTDSTGKKQTVSFANPYVYNEFAVYNKIIESADDLLITNFAEIKDGNKVITSDIILKNDILIDNETYSKTILNGDYSFSGRFEGNGKTITAQQTKSLFNEVTGTIQNLGVNGTIQIQNYQATETINDIECKTAYPIVAITNKGELRNIQIASAIHEKLDNEGIVYFPMIAKTNEANGTIEDVDLSPSITNYGNRFESSSFYFGCLTNKGIYQRIIFNVNISSLNDARGLTITPEAQINDSKSSNLFIHCGIYDSTSVYTLITNSILFATTDNCKINLQFKQRIEAVIKAEEASPTAGLVNADDLQKIRNNIKNLTSGVSWFPIKVNGVTNEDGEAYTLLMEMLKSYYDSLNAEEFSDRGFTNAGFADISYEHVDNAFWKFTGQNTTKTATLFFQNKAHKK